MSRGQARQKELAAIRDEQTRIEMTARIRQQEQEQKKKPTPKEIIDSDEDEEIKLDDKTRSEFEILPDEELKLLLISKGVKIDGRWGRARFIRELEKLKGSSD